MFHIRQASKIIFTGKEGSGKSLRLAFLARVVLDNNIYWKGITGKSRPIYTNMLFSDEYKKRASDNGIKVIEWQKLSSLVGLTGCDVFIDEIGIYFDSRLWAELPLAVRHWIAQCDKNGVNIYGTAQGFDQIDNSFRRLVTKLYHVNKVVGSSRPHPTYPPVKYPWGVFFTRDIPPADYKAKDPTLVAKGWPSVFLLSKQDYGVYNTNQKVEWVKDRECEHEVWKCSTEGCGYIRVKHSV